ncbi:hypothetical protein J3B02_004398 [Coemansia erecta]|uniref:Ribosomal protein/NADH dehydrogenase domain-containing protein n=1 Tax=Coemansia asiatica TaxID=1052880 RepID=A0A9W8CKG5_9FUNG|nr:hypothetical protein LPJ64_000895 [Coemansia asiatica]KAJ2846477.1 hypothetical protein J3B02_004398 [Coemansia erecta]KAJ2882480.1 hypothetical protein FB639_002383 [Coemansia asiatica]
MRIERILSKLETGLGATRLSPSIRSVTLTLSQRTRAPGARHFWRENLRRIQYANPNLPIEVVYPREPCMPKLEIKFANSAVESFSISGMRSDEICRKLLEKTT